MAVSQQMKEEERKERWHTVRSSKYDIRARNADCRKIGIKMIYSNLQVAIVMVTDFAGKTAKLKPSDL